MAREKKECDSDALAGSDGPGLLLRGADVLSGGREFPRQSVLVRRGKIRALGQEAERQSRKDGARRLELEGSYLAPGFIDLHTHGARGVDFLRAGPEELARALEHYHAHGVTSLLLSVYPTAWRSLLECITRLGAAVNSGIGNGALLGLHLEGPFLSPARPGALPARHFRPYTAASLRDLLQAGAGSVKTMTVAPERPRGRALLNALKRHRVVPAFGHSDATYRETRTAIAAGIRYATHGFNAMRGIHHREPGAVTALLEAPTVYVELIADGFHVDPAVLRLVHRLKPSQRVILVSDSAPLCGLRPGTYEFAGADARLRGGRVTRKDGRLAGSALTLDRAVALQVTELGLKPAQAVRLVTENPARLLGLSRSRGKVSRGQRADLVLLDRKLGIRSTWVAGRRAFARATPRRVARRKAEPRLRGPKRPPRAVRGRKS